MSSYKGIAVYNPQSGEYYMLYTFLVEDDRGGMRTDGDYFYVSWKLSGEINLPSDMVVINMSGELIARLDIPEKLILAAYTPDYAFFVNDF